MEVNILVGLSASTLVEDLILNGLIIPRPQGVKYNLTIQQGGWNTGEYNSFQWGSINP
jgi:hypothetical protein